MIALAVSVQSSLVEKGDDMDNLDFIRWWVHAIAINHASKTRSVASTFASQE